MNSYDFVESIPNSIVRVSIMSRDFSVTGISEKYLRIRMSQETCDTIFQKDTGYEITFSYLDYQNQKFETLLLLETEIVEKSKSGLFHEIVFEITNQKEDFRKAYDFIVRQYMNYITLKMNSYDNDFSEKLCHYPASEDTKLYDSFHTFWEDALSYFQYDVFYKEAKKAGLEVAVSFQSKREYELCVQKKILADRFYIGNEYCIHKSPDLEMIEKIKKLKLPVTIALPPLAFEKEAYLFKLLPHLKGCEVVANDWGTVSFLRENGIEVLTGTLLLRARKDPRFPYRICPDEEVKRNYYSLQAEQEEVIDLLQEMGIERVEIDQILQERRGLSFSYHVPLYQTNTSSFCTLRAILQYNDRGAQHPVKECEGVCENYFCSYPMHLSMIGIGNTLFGLDDSVFKDWSKLKNLSDKNINRIVWNGPLKYL